MKTTSHFYYNLMFTPKEIFFILCYLVTVPLLSFDLFSFVCHGVDYMYMYTPVHVNICGRQWLTSGCLLPSLFYPIS